MNNNAMKEMYEALQGVQHYSKKAMEAMQKMSSMGQRGGYGNRGGGGYSGGGYGNRDDWDNMGQREDMPFNPMMFM